MMCLAYNPHLIKHPCHMILREITAREWDVQTLRERLEWPPEALGALEQLLEGRVDIDHTIAHALARAFGTSAELWLNFQRNYDATHRRPRREWRRS